MFLRLTFFRCFSFLGEFTNLQFIKKMLRMFLCIHMVEMLLFYISYDSLQQLLVGRQGFGSLSGEKGSLIQSFS